MGCDREACFLFFALPRVGLGGLVGGEVRGCARPHHMSLFVLRRWQALAFGPGDYCPPRKITHKITHPLGWFSEPIFSKYGWHTTAKWRFWEDLVEILP